MTLSKTKPRPLSSQDLTGMQFGWWTVLHRGARPSTDNGHFWQCRCRCGVEREVASGPLTKGRSISCGCYVRARNSINNRRHGWRNHPLYKRWRQMIRRCHNPKDLRYSAYGGKGITVCDRWRKSLADFVEDMGMPVSLKLTIDRIDNCHGYEPGNCRWTTYRVQARNRGNTPRFSYRGITASAAEWEDIVGIDSNIIRSRRRNGWPIEKILTTPVNAYRPSDGVRGPTTTSIV